MKIIIKSIVGSVLFECDADSLKDALVAAVRQRADLQGAYLRDAYLRGADLRGADLQGAYLQGAYLQGADLQGAKNADYAIASTRILPEGDLIVWKKCRDNVLVKLAVPEKAKRSHAFGRKCRAEFVKVLEVIGAKVGISNYDRRTEYAKGQTIKCDKWNDDYTVECGGGIHFFITKEEALQFTP
jgi:Family of unknown function (DUF5758)/Pentapeptide repeats (8 copies)